MYGWSMIFFRKPDPAPGRRVRIDYLRLRIPHR